MKLLSINVGQKRSYPWRNGTESAMLKTPVEGAAELIETGLVGDEQGDIKAHGGVDKAVLCIPQSNYALFDIHEGFGFIGENLTLSDVDETQIQLGDRLQVGEVVLEVTQPRSPCWKLNEITHNPQFLTRYADSGRVGFYCRVIKSGKIRINDQVTLQHLEGSGVMPNISIRDLFLAKHRLQKRLPANGDVETLTQVMEHPALSKAWRQELSRLLEKSPA